MSVWEFCEAYSFVVNTQCPCEPNTSKFLNAKDWGGTYEFNFTLHNCTVQYKSGTRIL